MANPTRAHGHKLRRLGRYLVGSGRTVMRYDWQGHERVVTGYCDSDWAGCRVIGKSTSGGALMIGGHFLKGLARTQNHVTTSSAEGELIALVKCTAELLGIRSMMKDWGRERELWCGLCGPMGSSGGGQALCGSRRDKTERT